MILVELSSVPLAVLPMADLRDHLRLGTGFADDALQDGVLETCLRAAISAIEARTGKAVLTRSFRWSLTGWRDGRRQVLPVAPVLAVTRLALVDRQGTEIAVAPDQYGLESDAHRPALTAAGAALPAIPSGGSGEIEFDAGYAASWDGVPAGLRQAVLMLAAHFYEHRHAMAFEADGIPTAVNALLMPYLSLRLFGGGRA